MMKKIYILLSLITCLSVVGYLYLQSENTGKLEPVRSDITPEKESHDEVVTQKETDATSQIMQIALGIENIDYDSIDNLFNALQRQADLLLDAYQYHESNAESSAESQFALHLIQIQCGTTPLIETQEEYDRWISSIDAPPNDMIHKTHIQSVMQKIALCKQVHDYVGYENISDTRFMIDMLESAVKNGHPIARMVWESKKKTLSASERTKLLDEAYAYSKNHPQHRVEVYGEALRHLQKSNLSHQEINDASRALAIMALREGAIYKRNMSPSLVNKELQAELEYLLLPLEIDEIFARADRFSEAMENGDWSFLGLVKPVDSET